MRLRLPRDHSSDTRGRNDPAVVRAHFWLGLTHGLSATRATLAVALGGLTAIAVVGLMLV